MPNPRVKHRPVVQKSTAGILKPIPEAVDPVGNPPPGLTSNTVASLRQRGTANRRSAFMPGARTPANHSLYGRGLLETRPFSEAEKTAQMAAEGFRITKPCADHLIA